jgi:hypothetical protein
MSCEESEIARKDYPYVFMDYATPLADGAKFQARVESLGRTDILSYGFIWNETDDTNFEKWVKKNLPLPISVGTFTTIVNTDLSKDEVYFVRPFIETVDNTVFGPSVEFTSNGSKPPEVLGYYPKEGFDGTVVKLKGAYFSLKSQNISVFIMGIVPAQIVRSTEDSLVFTIPVSGAVGWVQLKIVSGDNEVLIEEAFKVLGPGITAVSQSEGHIGDIITIQGENFIQNGEPRVYFNEYQAEIIEKSPDILTVAVPFAYSYFSDNTVNIAVRSGQKVSLPDIPFTIKKSWDIKTATPFSWNYAYNAFSYNNLGYILEINEKVLYEYDPATDTWNAGPSFPGDRDDNNIFIISDNKLLKIGGTNHLGPVTSFWEYDFNTQLWNQKDDIPFTFSNATHVSLNEEEYIITNTGQVWTYNYSSQLFTRKNNIALQYNDFVFAYKENNGIYLVTYGSNWSYDISTDTWTEISKNNFNKDNYSNHAIGFYSNGIAYVLEDGQYLYKYYNDLARWILCGAFPGCRADNSYKTVFVIGDDAYIAAISGNYWGCSPFLFVYRD